MVRSCNAGYRGLIAAAIVSCGLSLPVTVAQAQDWPTKPITAMAPFGPGTSLEAAARPVFESMSRDLGQPIVIEHRPGAGGTTGSGAVARAAPDGYTLLLQSSSLSIAHSMQKGRTYDTLKDLIPVVAFGIQPYVLVVSPSKGFKTLDDLIKAAKAQPHPMNFATIGFGSAPHIAGERFRLAAGIEGQQVSYKGPPDALTETMTGRIDFYFTSLGAALPLIKDGKLVPLAVSTNVRAAELPDVPTLGQAGLKETGFELWLGLLAPAKTPADIIAKLHAAAQKALQSDAVRQRLDALGVKAMPLTQEQFAAYVKHDVEETAELIKKAKIEIP